MKRRVRSAASAALTWIVAAGPLFVLAAAVLGAVLIGLWWQTNVWVAFIAIVAELLAVMLVATTAGRLEETIRETRETRRDPTRWRHRRTPQCLTDRRRTVVRLAPRGGHRGGWRNVA